MKRKEMLENASLIVTGNREADYGSPEDNFKTIAKLWEVYLNVFNKDLKITEKDVGIMMALLKIARIAKSDVPDPFIDLAGYAACACEICTE